MAGQQGAAFYTPLFWPFPHLAAALTAPKDVVPGPLVSSPLGFMGHLSAIMSCTRNISLAWSCVFLLPYLFDTVYPGLGPASEWSWTWMWPILVRNIAGTWIICGGWDWLLYFSPLSSKLHKYKMTEAYPSNAQFYHDSFYTTIASLLAGVMEIILCHLWATGILSYSDISTTPALHILIALTTTHWRMPHFHFIHRMIHPWRTPSPIPDVGKFLYRHVHSLHHKSYNPSAFSGTSMHPIEAVLYYSAAFIPVCFGLHPVFAVGVFVDCGIGAWLGHDGFQWPGSGDFFHLLHHRHFDCNYGWPGGHLDYIFGTFAASKQDVAKIWNKNKKEE